MTWLLPVTWSLLRGMDPKKAVGGHVLAHASTIRLSVRKGRAENRVIKLVDAPNLKAGGGWADH